MLLFQYAVYCLTKWDRHIWKSYGFPAEISRSYALFGITIVESLWLAAIYIFVAHLLLKVPPYEGHSLIFELSALTALAASYVINRLMMGSLKRVQHYKRIFDEWDSAKHTRWKLCLFSLGVTGLIALNLAIMAVRPH
jgi:hypothetical protein